MAFQPIVASETDADSPLNQTLADKLRENGDGFNDGTAIGTDAITTDHIGTNQVGQLELAADSVGIAQLKTSSVTATVEKTGIGQTNVVFNINQALAYGFWPIMKVVDQGNSPTVGPLTLVSVYNHSYNGATLVLGQSPVARVALQIDQTSAVGGASVRLDVVFRFIIA